MGEPHDSELVRRCRDGDDGAFAELVNRYKALVFGLAVRSLRDPARAEDLAQDVFLRVYRGLPYFRGQARLSTWIYRITVNLCLEELGRRRGLEFLPLDETDGHRGAAPRVGGPDRAFAALELRDRLHQAIARLPPRYQMLIAGHYLQGIQYDELGEALGIPMGTVKTHLFRARRLLREYLEHSA